MTGAKVVVGIILLALGFAIGFLDVVPFSNLEVSQLAGLAGLLGMSTVVLTNKVLGMILTLIGGLLVSTTKLMFIALALVALLIVLS